MIGISHGLYATARRYAYSKDQTLKLSENKTPGSSCAWTVELTVNDDRMQANGGRQER